MSDIGNGRVPVHAVTAADLTAAAGPRPSPDPRSWRTLILLCAAQFMVVLDGSIVNVALPSIKTALHFSQASLPWVVNAYTLTFGCVSDVLGRSLIVALGLGFCFVPLAILAVSGTTDSDAGLASGLINAFLVGRVRGDRHRPGAAVRPEQPPGRGREKRRRRGVAGVDRGVTAGRFLVLPRQWSTRRRSNRRPARPPFGLDARSGM